MPNVFRQFHSAPDRSEWLVRRLAKTLGVTLEYAPEPVPVDGVGSPLSGAEARSLLGAFAEEAERKILALLAAERGRSDAIPELIHIYDQARRIRDATDRTLRLTGQIAACHVRELDRIGTLADVEFRVFSQWGEDGILEWLVSRLPGIPRVFVEFGVESYVEANTRFLVVNRGWRGLVMDGSFDNIDRLRADPIMWQHDICAVQAFVTTENVDTLISSNGFAGEIGVLSVDIDGNDYWVLERIACVNPAILVVEFNAVMGDLHDISIPYDARFERFEGHPSGQYYGASIGAMCRLALAKGYRFVGTSTAGVNAFFVRADLAGPVLGSMDEPRAWPSRHRDSRDAAGQLTFTSAAARADLISDLPVVDVSDGRTHTIASLDNLYSEGWAKEM